MSRALFLVLLLGCSHSTSQDSATQGASDERSGTLTPGSGDTGDGSLTELFSASLNPHDVSPVLVQVDEAGLLVEDGTGPWSLRTSAWGRVGAPVLQPNAPPTMAGCWPGSPLRPAVSCQTSVERALSDGRERWTVYDGQIEQGWTLDTAPPGSGPITITVEVLGATPILEKNHITLLTDAGGMWTYQSLEAWDADDQPLHAWMGVQDGQIQIMVQDARADGTPARWPIHVDPVVSSATTTITNTAQYDFGIGVSMGDFNNDGYDDAFVGARFGVGLYGSVLSYHGSSSGLRSTAAMTYVDTNYYGKMGEDVSATGDINGDGYDDALAAPFYAETLYVFHGSSSGLRTTYSTSVGPTGYGFGIEVSILGDYNNDGYDDVLVGDQDQYAYLYRGSSSGLNTTAVATYTTYGNNVTGAGDVNNDGYDDAIIANYLSGIAYVLHGSSSGLTLSTSLSPTGSSGFAYDVSRAGDVNGDGYDDVIVGEAGYNSNQGRVWVYHGSSTGISSSRYTRISGLSSNHEFGAHLGPAGDTNNDGYDDIAIAENGDGYGDTVYVYHGSASGALTTPSNTLSLGGHSGYNMGVGDVTNDGYSDLLIGDFVDRSVHLYNGCADADNDGYCLNVDCDDNNSAIKPGATEICDDVDNDCDGLTDDSDSGVSGRSTWYRDADSDGYGVSTSTTLACDQPSGYAGNTTDCNDGNAAINPAATEVCDTSNTDEDCDGLADNNDSSATGTSTFYRDADADSYGDATTTATTCDAATGYVANSTDCNDSSAAINPAATEICDTSNVDEDCDGSADDADPSASSSGKTTYYLDADADSYGTSSVTTAACDAVSGYVVNDDDCDDSSAAISPAATETCDGVDNDCDGLLDGSDPSVSGLGTWYRDADGDSYGTSASTTTSCSQPTGYVSNDDDCNDGSSAINPAASEVCDDQDNDCDGLTDDSDGSTDSATKTTFYADSDGDTYGDPAVTAAACDQPTSYVGNASDCDDSNTAINPAATEVCDDLDNDCDGLIDDSDLSVADAVTWYSDSDSDGYGDLLKTLQGCDQPTGYVANDDDCNDTTATANPAAAEVCDGLDNDCDGLTDSADASVDLTTTTTYYSDSDSDGYGDAATTTTACDLPAGYAANRDDCDDTSAAISPAATEVCDGRDNDCDGLADDSDDSTDSSSKDLFYGDGDGDGFGDSLQPTEACDQPTGYVADASDCDDDNSAINPAATEVCDSVDNDCDSLIDDNDSSVAGTSTWYADADSDTYGDSGATTQACLQPAGYVTDTSDCDDRSAAINPAASEVCDGADNDCDGLTDTSDPSVDTSTQATYYRDTDSDGYGDVSATILSCDLPSGYATNASDCDDADAAISPAATEICDSQDNDCDGLSDDADSDVTGTTTYYRDSDSDSFGDASTTTAACEAPTGYVADDTDCDDADNTIYPGAPDPDYDGIDQDCGGSTNDVDGDGHDSTAAGGDDCDDSNASTYPGATETWYDGVDSDCAGDNDYDQDVDGYDSDAYGGDDCDDTNAQSYPGAPEITDGEDNDCDGHDETWDEDGDGLSNIDEGTLGTDPTDPDSDADDLNDGDEVALGTDPLKPDSDSDGLSDGQEVDLATDPLSADSDGGGVSDGEEHDRGSDPLDAEDDDLPKTWVEGGCSCATPTSPRFSFALLLPLLALLRRRR